MIADECVAVLRLSLRGDADKAEKQLVGLGVAGSRSFAVLVGAAFTVAVRRKVHSPYTAAEPIYVVAEVRKHLGDGEDIDPRVAERLVRAALGERVQSDLDNRAKLAAQLAVLESLVSAEQLDDAQLDDFLEQAHLLASGWLQRGH